MPKLEVKIYKYGTVFKFLPNTWRCRIFRIITVHLVVILMQHSRLHTGAAREKTAEFTSTCVHVADTVPISSKPELQV